MVIKKKTLARWSIAICVACVVSLGFMFAYSYSSRQPRKIITRSYNILRANNKDILFFRSIGKDSLFVALATDNKAISFGTTESITSGEIRRIVEHNKKHIEKRLLSLDSIADVMQYYLDVHNVQDEGYEMVAKHNDVVKSNIKQTQALMACLNSIPESARLEILHIDIYENEDSVAIPDIFIEEGNAVWEKGLLLKIGRSGEGIARDKSHRWIRGTWNADTLVYGIRTDSIGTYRGAFDKERKAAGHGNYNDSKGNFYEGHWTDNRPDGFGFNINTENIKAGEWKSGKYKGERMNYTSERIYGIDISRYQHGKGKKYYPILWNKLNITYLGKANHKRTNGNVDYPVSFVYIKSTEGTSIRNKHYHADYKQARRHGLYCGAYHFFSTKSDAAKQAKFFIKHSYFNNGDFPPVLDVEPSDAQIIKMGGEKVLFDAIRTWMSIVKKHTGIRPILYVNQSFVNKYLSHAPDIKREYDVWIARYGEYRPDVRLLLWQLCPDGKVNGIHGDVDINVFNGYQDRFDLFLKTQLIKQ